MSSSKREIRGPTEPKPCLNRRITSSSGFCSSRTFPIFRSARRLRGCFDGRRECLRQKRSTRTRISRCPTDRLFSSLLCDQPMQFPPLPCRQTPAKTIGTEGPWNCLLSLVSYWLFQWGRSFHKIERCVLFKSVAPCELF